MQARLLIVDDTDFRDLLAAILAEDGHAVAAVSAAHEAVGAIARRTPDLVLIDCAVSAGSGLDLLRRVKSRSMWRHVPIIMLTDCDGDDQLGRAFAAGAADYILKPFSPAVVRSRVASTLRHDRLKRELHVSKARYQVAAQAARCGLWEWDLATDAIYLTTPLQELLGLHGNLPRTIHDWLGLVQAEDRESMSQALQMHAAGYSPEICVQHRMISCISGGRWFLTRGRTIEGEATCDGRRVVGAMIEITDRKFIEDSLRDSLRELAEAKARLEEERHAQGVC